MAGLVLAARAKVSRSVRTIDALTRSAQALCCAQAGLEVAKALVLTWQTDKMAGPVRLNIPVGLGTCDLEISDEQGRFNINCLIGSDGKPNQDRFAQLSRIAQTVGPQGQAAAGQILAWMVRRPGSAGPVGSLDELLNIEGLDRQVLDALIRYLTVYGDGQIDPNVADPVVLRSCLADQVLADRIIADRSEGPIGPLDPLPEAGLPKGAELRYLSTSAQEGLYLRVRSVGHAKGLARRVCAILHPNPSAGKVDVLGYWEQCDW
jgi:type II secretory pathway component PulK